MIKEGTLAQRQMLLDRGLDLKSPLFYPQIVSLMTTLSSTCCLRTAGTATTIK
ncbi:hypothetical protein BJX63DRAFT_405021 [Aspergillus granulosus]|uniref:Uncharacterized protein n=1 Tax=Aspergillus granulosus TaxID=176169 RepID=A0ABR4H2P2_9EURO